MRIVWCFIVASSITSGCGPAVSQEELGNVVYEVPAVPGADIPYPIPELKVTTSESEGGGNGDDHTN